MCIRDRIDTPGMRALSVVAASSGVEQTFRDLEALSSDCEYTNCAHSGEQGCALAAALSDGLISRERLDSWLRLRAEPHPDDRAADRRAVEDRKQRKATKVADRRAAKPKLTRGEATIAKQPQANGTSYL